jgi:hypothetical protein
LERLPPFRAKIGKLTGAVATEEQLATNPIRLAAQNPNQGSGYRPTVS